MREPAPRDLQLYVLGCLAWGCTSASEGTPALLVPSGGSVAGHYEVRVDLDRLELDPTALDGVTVGGIRAYGLEVEDGWASFQVQGAPSGGPAEVRLWTGEDSTCLSESFVYEATDEPVFEHFFAMGASLTQGVQAGVPSFEGTLNSPSAWIARQAQAWHPLPLVVPGLFPGVGVDDIGAPPECAIPDVVDVVTASGLEVFANLSDPESGDFGFQYARVDPDLVVQNVAVGGSNMADILYGPPEDDFGVQFVAHLVYEPYGELFDPVLQTQIELIEAGEPSLIVCPDLFGNDVVGALLDSDQIDVSLLTSLEDFEIDLEALLVRLEATGAEVFLGTVPRPSLLPATEAKKARMVDEGLATAEELDQAIAEIDALGAQFNQVLIESVADLTRIHVVDIDSAVASIEQGGLSVGDQQLHIGNFGGLLSLDGVHFSNTGYAYLANLFIHEINTTLETEIPEVDLAEVLSTDPHAPSSLVDAGLDIEACLASTP